MLEECLDDDPFTFKKMVNLYHLSDLWEVGAAHRYLGQRWAEE